MTKSILENKNIFMTGATSGLGKVAACKIAAKGANLIVTCRNTQKGNDLQQFYKENFPDGKGRIELVECNLNSFESVLKACNEVHSKIDKLDMIVNNAGIMNFSLKESVDGIEETIHVNLLSLMLIIDNLTDLLEKSDNAKIINTASALHKGVINFDDFECREKYKAMESYRQSKLGVILMGRLLAPKLAANNIGIYSQHPGVIRTEIARDAGWLMSAIFWLMGKSAEKGVETLLHLVETPAEKLTSGEYYANSKVKTITRESNDLDMAQKLSETIKSYLEQHLKKPSPVF